MNIAGLVWRDALSKQLPLLGHRNWVIVADAAFPLQIAPGVETVFTGRDHVEVLAQVLTMLGGSSHVAPVVWLDAEIEYVPESLAPGIEAYRSGLKGVLGDLEVRFMPHADLLKKVDLTGKLFKILVLKTTLALPYTSVFFELECGYWGPESEKAMRTVMAKKRQKGRRGQ